MMLQSHPYDANVLIYVGQIWLFGLGLPTKWRARMLKDSDACQHSVLNNYKRVSSSELGTEAPSSGRSLVFLLIWSKIACSFKRSIPVVYCVTTYHSLNRINSCTKGFTKSCLAMNLKWFFSNEPFTQRGSAMNQRHRLFSNQPEWLGNEPDRQVARQWTLRQRMLSNEPEGIICPTINLTGWVAGQSTRIHTLLSNEPSGLAMNQFTHVVKQWTRECMLFSNEPIHQRV